MVYGVRWGRLGFWAVLAAGVAAGLLNAMPVPGILHHKESAAKEEKRREKAVMKEMESPYKKWLTEEVPYIITSDERTAFLKMTTDAERQQFIEQFWERRNPNPGSSFNEYKEEYYRRIAYANEHYSSGIPGWKTDRGRIYIMYGPPDEIQSHPSGGTYTPDPNSLPYTGSGAATTMTTYPFEDWRYRYIPSIGNNVELEFVDPTMTGEYHLTMNPCEKDAMSETPGDLTGCQGGVANGSIWNPNLVIAPSSSLGQQGAGVTSNLMGSQEDEFNRLDLYSKIFQPPKVDFNDLKAVVTSRLSPNMIPFQVRMDYIKLTNDVVLVPITIQVANRNIEFQNKDGVMHASMDIFTQLGTLSGRIADTSDQGVDSNLSQHDFQSYSKQKLVYQRIVPLHPGRYKLTVVIKDSSDGRMGSNEIGFVVPTYTDGKLEASSLILADDIHPLPTSEVGAGPFNIGGTHVRPAVDDVFTPQQQLGIYMQVYNLGVNPKTSRPSADVQYTISKDGQTILNQTESSATVKDAGEQMTLEKQMPVKALKPGKYTVRIKVTDNIKKASEERSANFQVD